jgi:hypothetical protein
MMRSLLRSVAVISALSLPLIAHADTVTYSGTVTLTDTTTGHTIGTFASDPFTFTDTGLSSSTGTFFNPFLDPISINGVINNDDQISLDVSFTDPGSGSGDLLGEDFKTTGLFGSNNIDWDYPTVDSIDLSNGSVAVITLPNFLGFASTALHSCGDGKVCGSSDLGIYITDNDPAAAPEPSSLFLLGTGVIGAAGMIRRRFAV